MGIPAHASKVMHGQPQPHENTNLERNRPALTQLVALRVETQEVDSCNQI